MKRTRIPKVTRPRPPILAAPRLVKILHSLSSFSFGSGLCNQSSFSISSGNNRSPADGNILYFSDSVCVLTCSSSLPDRDGARDVALESAKGSLPKALPSELKLVLRDRPSTGDPGTDSSSRNLCVLERVGGMSKVSAESNVPPLYIRFKVALFLTDGAAKGLC